jgi:hypothetical protein
MVVKLTSAVRSRCLDAINSSERSQLCALDDLADRP